MTSAQSSPTQPTADLPIVVQDRRRHGFYMIDNSVLDRFGKELKPTGIAVYNGLARYTNREGECWPSQATLATLVGMSRMQVSREIDKLKRLGLIDVQTQYGPNGGQRANLYLLLNVPKEEESVTHRSTSRNTQLHPPVTGSDTPHHRQLHKQNPENKTNTEQNPEEQQHTRDSHEDSLVVSDAQPDVVVAISPALLQVQFDEVPRNSPKETAAREFLVSSVEEPPTPLSPPAPGQTAASALIAVGIAPKVAHRLASHYSRERIEEKLAYLDFLQADQPNKVQNPRGWLRRAIEEDYAVPDGYKSAEERTLETTEVQRHEEERQRIITARDQQAKAERERQRQEATDRLTRLYTLYGTTQQETDLWKEMLAEFKLSMSAASFAGYVADTVLLSLKDSEALISLPNARARDWMENRFAAKIQRTFASCLGGQKVTVKFIDLNAE